MPKSEPAAKRSRGRPRSTWNVKDTGTVQALDRGLQILAALSGGRSATLSDLADSVAIPPSSTHRLLMTLQSHGFVEFRDDSQEWIIGLEAFRVGNAFLQRTNLMESGREVMHRLMADTGETANLAVAADGHVVFVSQVETHHPIRAFFSPGTRSAMHVSGIGKALMAQMPRVQVDAVIQRHGLPAQTPNTLATPGALFADLYRVAERGWSLDDEEANLGMRCVAAPIFNAYGEAIAGVSVSGPSVRLTDYRVPGIAELVKSAALDITHSIGGTP